MRKLFIVAVMLCASSAWAQMVGVDLSIEPLLPGLQVRLLRETPRMDALGRDTCGTSTGPVSMPWECIGSPPFPGNWGVYGAFTIGFDAAGNAYHVATSQVPTDFGNGISGNLLRRVSPTGVTEDVARVIRRICLTPDCRQKKEFNPEGLLIDVTRGRIWMTINAYDINLDSGQTVYTIGTMEINGLPTLFDTLLTFIPSGQLEALVPAHPDGFRAADSMQVWACDVRTLPDWSQAQTVTCNAATSPTPGQVVSIADTLPDPATGHGRYYLTASVSGPYRRLGRHHANGVFSARNPSTLPICQ